MRRWGTGAIALALLAPSAVAARDVAVTLAPGEAVTLPVMEDGGFGTPVRGKTGARSDFERGVAAAFASGRYDAFSGPAAGPLRGPSAPSPPGQLSFRFVVGASPDRRLLVVENGTGTPVRYRARIVVAGQARPTDVCTVLPHLRAVEEWPEPIERITLSAIELDRSAPADRPICK